MVTGRVPFVAETPLAVILKHVSDPLPPPSTLKPDIPEAIERVILKALAKRPDDRYTSVSEFLSDWKRALEEAKSPRRTSTENAPAYSTPASARPPQTYGTPAPAPKAASKSGGWAGWAVGCLVGLCALLALGGGALFIYNSSTGQSPTETPLPTQTDIPPTNTPQPTETLVSVTKEVILEDDFSDDSIWGLLDETTTSIAYDQEALRIKVFEKNWIVWTTPNAEMYEDVHVEVTAHNNDGEPTTAFGIMCYQQEEASSYYYGLVTPGGEYIIAKAVTDETDFFFTNDNQWGSSDLIEDNATSYRIGMDCGDGVLSLYVNGQLVDSVTDETYTSGTSGLVVWSGEDISSADVTFDDFIVTSLE